jgi:hypothetical protein
MNVKLLVLTSEPITAAQLREAVGADSQSSASAEDGDGTEVMVVAPALAESPLKFWLSDADAAIERAEQVREQTVSQLAAEGVAARGDTGESDPVQAIADALQTFPAERIVVFTHPGGDGRRYREEIDDDELTERFGLPVDHASLAR